MKLAPMYRVGLPSWIQSVVRGVLGDFAFAIRYRASRKFVLPWLFGPIKIRF